VLALFIGPAHLSLPHAARASAEPSSGGRVTARRRSSRSIRVQFSFPCFVLAHFSLWQAAAQANSLSSSCSHHGWSSSTAATAPSRPSRSTGLQRHPPATIPFASGPRRAVCTSRTHASRRRSSTPSCVRRRSSTPPSHPSLSSQPLPLVDSNPRSLVESTPLERRPRSGRDRARAVASSELLCRPRRALVLHECRPSCC
jgi:hypothetical protein